VTQALASSVAAGDPMALARAISLVEEGTERGEAIVAALFQRTGRASVVGITGPPGAGKSSLANRLVELYRSRGRTLGVIAVDPSSAFSGGALLGDRIRMQQHALDPAVFIRSMATRGRFGGLSRATRDVVDLMDASGRDPILIETVGVGQDEVDVVRVADTVLVVLTPGQGDDIQAIKAGLLEIADVFVINKADHPGADRLAADLEGMLSLGGRAGWIPPIVRTVATEGRGIQDLAEAAERHASFLRDGGELAARRRAGLSSRFQEILRDRLLGRIVAEHPGQEELAACAARLETRRIDPYTAAREILARVPGLGAETGADCVLDHVGIAVRRIEDRLGLYRDVLGLDLAGIEEVRGERVRAAILPAGGTRIELLEPLTEDSPIARFLRSHGEGVHHICFEVGDLEGMVDRFKRAGAAPAGTPGTPGAGGSRIAFIHPRGAGGVLIELRQGPRATDVREGRPGRAD
jgi:LAO/AO transport system kinase